MMKTQEKQTSVAMTKMGMFSSALISTKLGNVAKIAFCFP